MNILGKNNAVTLFMNENDFFFGMVRSLNITIDIKEVGVVDFFFLKLLILYSYYLTHFWIIRVDFVKSFLFFIKPYIFPHYTYCFSIFLQMYTDLHSYVGYTLKSSALKI